MPFIESLLTYARVLNTFFFSLYFRRRVKATGQKVIIRRLVRRNPIIIIITRIYFIFFYPSFCTRGELRHVVAPAAAADNNSTMLALFSPIHILDAHAVHTIICTFAFAIVCSFSVRVSFFSFRRRLSICISRRTHCTARRGGLVV